MVQPLAVQFHDVIISILKFLSPVEYINTWAAIITQHSMHRISHFLSRIRYACILAWLESALRFLPALEVQSQVGSLQTSPLAILLGTSIKPFAFSQPLSRLTNNAVTRTRILTWRNSRRIEMHIFLKNNSSQGRFTFTQTGYTNSEHWLTLWMHRNFPYQIGLWIWI